jgi:hypothetical protein
MLSWRCSKLLAVDRPVHQEHLQSTENLQLIYTYVAVQWGTPLVGFSSAMCDNSRAKWCTSNIMVPDADSYSGNPIDVECFTECQCHPSGTWQTTFLSSVARKKLDKKTHGKLVCLLIVFYTRQRSKFVSVQKVVPTLTSNERWDLPLDGRR